MNFDDLKTLAGLSLRDPDRAVAALLGLGVPMSARWMALVLTVTLSALLAWAGTALFPVETGSPVGALVAQPMTFAGMQMAGLVLAAALMAGVGRLFGGQGNFPDALLLVVWIEFLLLVVQAVQVVLMLVFPAVASILGLVAVGLFLWLAVRFARALHGFQSVALVALGMLGTMLVAGFILSFIAAAFGLIPEIPA